MEEIVAHARELGRKIAAHPRCVEFMVAAKAVAEDKDAQAVYRAYHEQAQRIQSLQATGKPIEPNDKRKMADCEAQIAGNEKLRAMLKHQANYLEMMNRINRAIDEAVQDFGDGPKV